MHTKVISIQKTLCIFVTLSADDGYIIGNLHSIVHGNM